ncbi:hypothetical protein BAZOLSSOX_2377 [uncultured Gammaproteobacteria bacterium]|nr:hypothetical protein BAZOLSSOX_2377 [uncultured Gammaproteobacteria bacterium]
MDLKMKKFITLKSIIILYIIIIALYSNKLIDTESKITLTSFGSGLGGLIAIIGLYFFYQRLEKQQKQIDIQIDQRVDERFNSAISLLGSSETSARTGAIYALYELAIEEEKYRSQIAQILCSHIRSKTNETEYKDTHSERPSNEIQTTIDLLFKEKGLYGQEFARVVEFPKANLSHAYLMGADFTNAWCQGVNFKYAQCQRTFFIGAQCQDASFFMAQCQGANFLLAQCQDASFWMARCQEANFRDAQLQGADFRNTAQLQGADFRNAQCQEADFKGAECQGADFEGAKFDRPHDIQIKGEISDKAIKAIEDAKPYLDNSWYEKMQKIIKENKGKDPEFRTYGP